MGVTRTLRRFYKGAQLSEQEIEVFRAIYDANVRMLDQALGSFLSEVLTGDVAVIVTSDHGENAFSRKQHDTGVPYAGKNQTLYETEVHVPLVLLHKSSNSPSTVGNAVSHVDLAPTMLDLLEVDGIEQFQGQPLWEREGCSPVFMERLDWFSRKEAAWLEWPWKLVAVPGPESDKTFPHRHKIELYNLENDPQETRNVYQEKRTIATELIEELLEFSAQQTAFYRECHRDGARDDNELIRERLRMLGYIN